MLQKIVEAHGGKLPDDVHVGFQNTGREHPKTLRFINECGQRFGANVVWMEYCRIWGQPDDAPHFKIVSYETADRTGEPFKAMLRYYAAYRAAKGEDIPLPSIANRMCTAYLKIKTSEKWMQSMGYEEWDSIVGIRADEPKRHKKMMEANERGYQRYYNVLPLWEAGVTQEHVQTHWAAMPFDLGIHSDDGNCDGCFLVHQDKLIRRFRRDPSRADFWIGLEEWSGKRFRIDRPGYKELKFVAMEMNKQMDAFPETLPSGEEDIADCICG